MIAPVAAFSVRPGGSDPVATDHVLGATPPELPSVARKATPTSPRWAEGALAVSWAPTVSPSVFCVRRMLRS